jgi:hypothetical protein
VRARGREKRGKEGERPWAGGERAARGEEKGRWLGQAAEREGRGERNRPAELGPKERKEREKREKNKTNAFEFEHEICIQI